MIGSSEQDVIIVECAIQRASTRDMRVRRARRKGNAGIGEIGARVPSARQSGSSQPGVAAARTLRARWKRSSKLGFALIWIDCGMSTSPAAACWRRIRSGRGSPTLREGH
jgi:hypothetical protein